MPEIAQKPCTKCGLTKPLSDFGANKQGKQDKSARCKSCMNAYQKAWAAQCREALVELPPTKRCPQCGETKPTEEGFHSASQTRDGFAIYCRVCSSARHAAHFEANRERVLARNAAHKKANPEARRASRKRCYHRHPDREKAAHRAWVAKNPAYVTDYAREYRRQRAAVEEGKSSPICRREGFALALTPAAGTYRAARLDRPLDRGEVGVAHFHYGLAGVQAWAILPPPVLSTRYKAIFDKLAAREMRGRSSGDGRLKPVAAVGGRRA